MFWGFLKFGYFLLILSGNTALDGWKQKMSSITFRLRCLDCLWKAFHNNEIVQITFSWIQKTSQTLFFLYFQQETVSWLIATKSEERSISTNKHLSCFFHEGRTSYRVVKLAYLSYHSRKVKKINYDWSLLLSCIMKHKSLIR